jgi:hypothetical protein
MAESDLSEPEGHRLTAPDAGRIPAVPRWVGLMALVVVLLGASAWVIAQQFTSSHHNSGLSPASSYTTFKDPAGLFQIGYPHNWKQLSTTNPQFVLLVQGPHGASYQVAKTTLTAPVNGSNLAAATKLTSTVVKSGNHVSLLRPAQAVSLGGLPGILYLYLFIDPTTGEHGAHAQYFLFDGKTMLSLVFQSLPSNNFRTLAPLFDRISSTFHVLSR